MMLKYSPVFVFLQVMSMDPAKVLSSTLNSLPKKQLLTGASKKLLTGNTKGGSITVPLTCCLTGLESAVLQLTIFVFICKTDEFKPVKQEVNSTVLLPPLVFPVATVYRDHSKHIDREQTCTARIFVNKYSKIHC